VNSNRTSIRFSWLCRRWSRNLCFPRTFWWIPIGIRTRNACS